MACTKALTLDLSGIKAPGIVMEKKDLLRFLGRQIQTDSAIWPR